MIIGVDGIVFIRLRVGLPPKPARDDVPDPLLFWDDVLGGGHRSPHSGNDGRKSCFLLCRVKQPA